MITTFLIIFFRWFWECSPLTDVGKEGLVVFSIFMTAVELACIGYCIEIKRNEK